MRARAAGEDRPMEEGVDNTRREKVELEEKTGECGDLFGREPSAQHSREKELRQVVAVAAKTAAGAARYGQVVED